MAMRVIVFGASGRVGIHLVEAVLGDPGLDLAAAVVSPQSDRLGITVAGGSLEYRAADPTMNAHSDVIVDFSTPGASIDLQCMLARKPIPVVIGTTGLSRDQQDALKGAASYRPILTSANFAVGFEPFLRAVSGFAGRQPGAEATIEETYHARKKAAPSGTSLRLSAGIHAARIAALAALRDHAAVAAPPISVRREGQTVGVNTVRFEMGASNLTVTFTVHSLAAYAQGALAAARWLVESAPGPGLYELADMFAADGKPSNPAVTA